jgi:hypothetical protein
MAVHPTEAIQRAQPAPRGAEGFAKHRASLRRFERPVADETEIHVDAEHRRCAYEEALRVAERQWMLDSPETG